MRFNSAEEVHFFIEEAITKSLAVTKNMASSCMMTHDDLYDIQAFLLQTTESIESSERIQSPPTENGLGKLIAAAEKLHIKKIPLQALRELRDTQLRAENDDQED